MFISLETATIAQYGFAKDSPFESRRKVNLVFERALRRGQARAFWSRLVGRDNSLRDLNRVISQSTPRPARHAGVVNVALSKIVGSESRGRDFDSAFYPLCDHNRDRWVGIALARLHGIALPPVDLIQVGDEYFVRDGHHRVSVAAAAGQAEIEARILFALTLGN